MAPDGATAGFERPPEPFERVRELLPSRSINDLNRFFFCKGVELISYRRGNLVSKGRMVSLSGRVPSSDGGMVSSRCGVPSSDGGMGSSRCGVPSSDGGMVSSRCGVPSSDGGMVSSRCGVPSSGGGIGSYIDMMVFFKELKNERSCFFYYSIFQTFHSSRSRHIPAFTVKPRAFEETISKIRIPLP